ncbi:MAG: hypothetical protein AAGD06_25210 [Acidobacteriota bacterium]
MPDFRRLFRPIPVLLLLLAAPASALVVQPIGPDAAGGAQRYATAAGGLEKKVQRASELLREQIRTAPACRAYFDHLGVDLDAWLAADVPPTVVPRRLRRPNRWIGDPICGAAQAREPFERIYVDPSCFRGPRSCELASLLLHEMGHLARRDTRDNEPRDFFDACRLSFCVDPARFQ